MLAIARFPIFHPYTYALSVLLSIQLGGFCDVRGVSFSRTFRLLGGPFLICLVPLSGKDARADFTGRVDAVFSSTIWREVGSGLVTFARRTDRARRDHRERGSPGSYWRRSLFSSRLALLWA